jgi:hypothetical protein
MVYSTRRFDRLGGLGLRVWSVSFLTRNKNLESCHDFPGLFNCTRIFLAHSTSFSGSLPFSRASVCVTDSRWTARYASRAIALAEFNSIGLPLISILGAPRKKIRGVVTPRIIMDYVKCGVPVQVPVLAVDFGVGRHIVFRALIR